MPLLCCCRVTEVGIPTTVKQDKCLIHHFKGIARRPLEAQKASHIYHLIEHRLQCACATPIGPKPL